MNFDVCIIGNGILGCTTALLLLENEPALKVALIGPRSRKAAASLAAGAMLNLFAEIEAGALAHPLYRYKFELGLKAAALWAPHVEFLNSKVGPADKLSIEDGTFIINNTRADSYEDESFEAVQAALKEYQQPFQLIDPKSIPAYRPTPTCRALRAMYLPNEGYIPSRLLFNTIDKALATASGLLQIDATVTELKMSSGTRELTLSDGQKLSAGKVLIANGAAAQKLIDQLPELKRRTPRLFYGVGCGLILRPPEMLTAVVRTNNRGMACGVHTVPNKSAGTVYVGASNFISPEPEYAPRMTSLHGLLRATMQEINVRYYKALVEEVVVGHRPTSADLFPLIGPTSVPGLWLMTGTKRDGLFMSPVYCRAMVEALLRGSDCFEKRFIPERPLIKTLTREEGQKKALANMWSSGYQHELHLPQAGWEPRVQEMLERGINEAYQKAGEPDYGIPPELLDMYRYGHIKPTEV